MKFKKGHKINNGREPWNKGLTKKTSKRVARYSKAMIGNKLSKETIDKIRESRKGFKHTEETRIYLGGVLKKAGVKTRFKKGVSNSLKTEFKKGQVPWNIGIHMPQIQGENHPNWKGGATNKNEILN